MSEEIRLSSSPDERRRARSAPSALEFALARLARRSYGEAELVARMERAGYSAGEIASAVDHLRSRRYLDDRAFALGVARSAAENKLWGPARIRRMLRERGIDEPDIQEAVRAAFPRGETGPLARALTRFRRTDRRGGSVRQRKERAFRHLLGRGFSSGAIREALRAKNLTVENEST